MKISVVCPYHNAENTLERSILSILNQTYPDIELLLINNCSTDRGPTIAQKYADKDERITLLTESQKGIVPALNNGIKHAQGEVIARMDADDYALPERLLLQLDFLKENPGFGLVSSKAQHISNHENDEGLKRYVKWSNSLTTHRQMMTKRFIESPIIHPTVMFRKSVVDKFGGYESGNFPEDYELWLRWMQQGVKMQKLSKILLHWYDDVGRLTRNHENYSDEAFFQIKTQYLSRWLATNNPFHPDVYIWGASKISRKRAQLLIQEHIQIKGFIDTNTSRQLEQEVIHYSQIPSPKEAFILVYMKHHKIRNEIEDYLKLKGFKEYVNYLLLS